MKQIAAAPLLREAEALTDSFKLPGAEQLVRRVLQGDPKNAQAHAILAKIMLYSQREELALKHAEKAFGTRLGSFVARRLAEHFTCVTRMAIRQEKPQPKAFALLDKAQRLAGDVPQNAGIDLSAILIVKNEEAHLARCLDSLKGLVDEIVVIDTGSTDRTLEIAAKYGAVIDNFPWCDDFASARNASLSKATGQWALWIDADEELTPQSHVAVRKALVRPQYAGFNISIVNFTEDEGQGDQFVHAPVRLFRMLPGVSFTGRIHEQVAESLFGHGLPLAHLDGAQMLHYGYRPSIMTERNKLERTLTMLEKEVAEKPDDSFQWFNLANAYSVAKRYAEAEVACRRSIQTMAETDSHAHNAFQILTEVLEQEMRYDDALAAISEAENRGFGWIQTEYSKASILLSRGELEKALAAIQNCITMEWPAGRSGDFSIVTYKRNGLLGQVLYALGRWKEAEIALKQALKVADNPMLRWTLAEVYEHTDRSRQAAALFKSLAADPALGEGAAVAYARCALSAGDAQSAAQAFEEVFHVNVDNADAWVGWVAAAEQLGDGALILRAYEEYAKHHDLTASLLVNWGRNLAQAGSIERALDCFSEALKRDPSDANAYFNCGDVLYNLKQFADAAQMYEGGLRRLPGNVEGWFVLGNSLAQMGILEGAQVAYNQCLALRPGHQQARHNLQVISEAA